MTEAECLLGVIPRRDDERSAISHQAIPTRAAVAQISLIADSSLSDSDEADINAFLNPVDSRLTYRDLYGWSVPKLDRLLARIDQHDLSTIAQKSLAAKVTEAPLKLTFDDVHYANADGSCILLQGITGFLRPRDFIGLVGAPDAGVSTLLDVLADRTVSGEVSGRILFDGLMRSEVRGVDRAVGYVRREAKNFARLTVQETLYFSAKLRLAALPIAIINFRVAMAMKLLGLTHVSESLVGDSTIRGISGGESRRVAYGCELVAGHSVMLCDSITDGLDSATALSVMKNFKMTVTAGRSMMAALSQPSPELFDLFDLIIVLSKGAQIYFGPRLAVVSHLRHYGFIQPAELNLPDFLEQLSASPARFWQMTSGSPSPLTNAPFPLYPKASDSPTLPPASFRLAPVLQVSRQTPLHRQSISGDVWLARGE